MSQSKNEFPYGWDDMTPDKKISHALNRLGKMSAMEAWGIRTSPEYIKAKKQYDELQRIADIVFPDKKMFGYPPCGMSQRCKN